MMFLFSRSQFLFFLEPFAYTIKIFPNVTFDLRISVRFAGRRIHIKIAVDLDHDRLHVRILLCNMVPAVSE